MELKIRLAGAVIAVALTVGCAASPFKTQQSYGSARKGVDCDRFTFKAESQHDQRSILDSESRIDKWEEDKGLPFILARFIGSRKIPRCPAS